MNFSDLFSPIPAGHISDGFIEVGEGSSKGYEFEGPVDFVLGPDGAVWAKIAESFEHLPASGDQDGSKPYQSQDADETPQYVLVNLALRPWSGNMYAGEFYIPGEDPHTYGNLDLAAEACLRLRSENDNHHIFLFYVVAVDPHQPAVEQAFKRARQIVENE